MTDKEWRDAWFKGLCIPWWSATDGKIHFFYPTQMSVGAVEPAQFAMCQCGHRSRFHLAKAPFCLMAGCNCRGFVATEEIVV